MTEMEQPKVSIVVPCFKKARYLTEALDSLLAQTFTNWECAIVNDGSPDNTEEIALKYCERDSRFRYLCQLNQGVSSARNNGIKQMDGKYILALDADDWISDSYVEKAVRYLEEHPEVKLVYSRYESFGPQGKHEWKLPPYSYEGFVMGDMVIVCSAVFRRDDFDRVGGYDETMQGYEDWDFWLSILNENDKVYRLDEVLFHYRNGSSIVSNQVSKDIKAFRHRLCQKHEDIYMPRYADLLFYYGMFQENDALKRELEKTKKVYSSYAYRLGKLLMKPFSWVRNSLEKM